MSGLLLLALAFALASGPTSARARLLTPVGRTTLQLRTSTISNERYLGSAGEQRGLLLQGDAADGGLQRPARTTQQIHETRFGASHGVLDGLTLGGQLPIVFVAGAREDLKDDEGVPDPQPVVGLGDLRLWARARLWERGARLATATAYARLPTGSPFPGPEAKPSYLTGWGQTDLGLGLEAEAGCGWLSWTAGLRATWRLPARVPYLTSYSGRGNATLDPGDELSAHLRFMAWPLPWLGVGLGAAGRVWRPYEVIDGLPPAQQASSADEQAHPGRRDVPDSGGYLATFTPQLVITPPHDPLRVTLGVDLHGLGRNTLPLRRTGAAGGGVVDARLWAREENATWALTPTGRALGDSCILGELFLTFEVLL